MILFPAIDLQGGRCVRLEEGRMERATVFNDNPAAQALAFEVLGFSWLHLVDLDGAFAGLSVNRDAIAAILAAIRIPVQLGGGIRDRAAIEGWLEAGVRRVILGTAALNNPELVREAARAHPGRIAVAVDAREGRVAVEGWSRFSSMEARELAARFADAGVAAIVFTDIGRDGMLRGLNIEAVRALAACVPLPVVASGGVAGIGDIDALRASGANNIEGVVIGRALYDGRIDAKEALERAAD